MDPVSGFLRPTQIVSLCAEICDSVMLGASVSNISGYITLLIGGFAYRLWVSISCPFKCLHQLASRL